jgi:RND family efflux transporter MFP subunit
MARASAARRRLALACAMLACLLAPLQAAELVLTPQSITETKAVYGRVESRFVIPARSRIGGTLVELSVSEGSVVAAGQVIARVVDEKLALQIAAVDARIRAATSELANARAEYERVQALLARGATTQQRIDQARTQVEVLVNQVAQANAERALVVQQGQEGEVAAPAAGQVLAIPARRGGVIMPGEPVAMVAGGGLFLRLAIPERHAPQLSVGASVTIGERGLSGGSPAAETGRIEKIYPQIENGRVIADVELARLPSGATDDARREQAPAVFVGERVLVQVPVATRAVLAVPPAAIVTRSGLDMVRIATPAGAREVIVVTGGVVATAAGLQREILSGLSAGDRVVLP